MRLTGPALPGVVAMLAVAIVASPAPSPDRDAVPVASVAPTGDKGTDDDGVIGTDELGGAEGLLAESGCQPAHVLKLDTWKLTLPTGSKGKPNEILPLNLGKVIGSPFFQSTRDCEGVVFRAPVNGATTKGSKNPRSELREMGRGGAKASWSSGTGTHWMAVTEAFTALPKGKPHLVGAQIHDGQDDVTVFRLEGTKLWVTDGDNPHYKLVKSDYKLGTVFQAAYLVRQNMVGAYYDGTLVAVLEKPFSNAYFKAGAYTQANCSNSPCRPDNYGETVIYALDIGHG